mmetsp:Transcript_17312/g.47269  ORF Transcript_17312/g.47269 Transcript_17312/m.47269 type:complete len:239 (+) Transcript_17312:257-973(+)
MDSFGNCRSQGIHSNTLIGALFSNTGQFLFKFVHHVRPYQADNNIHNSHQNPGHFRKAFRAKSRDAHFLASLGIQLYHLHNDFFSHLFFVIRNFGLDIFPGGIHHHGLTKGRVQRGDGNFRPRSLGTTLLRESTGDGRNFRGIGSIIPRQLNRTLRRKFLRTNRRSGSSRASTRHSARGGASTGGRSHAGSGRSSRRAAGSLLALFDFGPSGFNLFLFGRLERFDLVENRSSHGLLLL